MHKTDVLIIGGGILGCAAAYYLAKRHVSVLLVDKGPLASEATGATTAGLTLQNRTPEKFPFYQAAFAHWPSLSDELQTNLGYQQCGSVVVANTAESWTQLQQKVAALQTLGLKIELLTPNEAHNLCPWLTDDLAGVSYCPSDGFAEPERPSQAFAAAAKRLGARLWLNCPVESLTAVDQQGFRAATPKGDIQAKLVVNAAGAWAGQVANMVGVTLPITLDPLQAMATEAAEPWLDKVVLHTSGKLTMKQNQDGRVTIGGGWQAQGDLRGGAKTLLPGNRAANLALAHRSVPKMADLSIVEEWVGLEGRSPDRLPFFGEVTAVPGFYMLACVHGGFALSPLLGSQLAELIVEGRTSFPMDKFSCQEFLPAVKVG